MTALERRQHQAFYRRILRAQAKLEVRRAMRLAAMKLRNERVR